MRNTTAHCFVFFLLRWPAQVTTHRCRLITVNDRRYQKILLYKKPQSIKQFCLQQMHFPRFTSIWSYFTPRGRGLGVWGEGIGGGGAWFVTLTRCCFFHQQSLLTWQKAHKELVMCNIYSFSENSVGIRGGLTHAPVWLDWRNTWTGGTVREVRLWFTATFCFFLFPPSLPPSPPPLPSNHLPSFKHPIERVLVSEQLKSLGVQ